MFIFHAHPSPPLPKITWFFRVKSNLTNSASCVIECFRFNTRRTFQTYKCVCMCMYIYFIQGVRKLEGSPEKCLPQVLVLLSRALFSLMVAKNFLKESADIEIAWDVLERTCDFITPDGQFISPSPLSYKPVWFESRQYQSESPV